MFDWKIGVMHDPDIAFGLNKIREILKEHNFDVFVYGHTHEANIQWEGKSLLINPGSPTVSKTSFDKPTVGMLKITKDAIEPEIVNIEEIGARKF